MKIDLYEEITNKIVAALESGTAPWQKPWSGGLSLPKRANGEFYSGVNVFVLWLEKDIRGYKSDRWLTFKQALAEGGCVRKGQKGTHVVYWSQFTKTNDEGEEESIPFMRSYVVFNEDQIDGLTKSEPEETVGPFERLEAADEFFAATGAKIVHGGDRACYSPSADEIRMPRPESFRDKESYYSTLAHECVHWTGPRLEREFGKRFGDQAYAFEELVAELGAAYTCAELGITSEPRADHASYLASWLSVLRADKRAIFTAASSASKAVKYLKEASHVQSRG